MANHLIKCPVCGHALSSGADKCPNCGEKIKSKKARSILLGIIGLILTVFGIAGVILLQDIDIGIDTSYQMYIALFGMACMLIGFTR